MTDTLIQTIARAMCEQHIREVRRWDTDPAKLEAMMPEAVDYSWSDHAAIAEAVLTALHDAGYAIVPREPTEAMLWAGRDKDSEGGWSDNPQNIYRAMIAAITTGERNG